MGVHLGYYYYATYCGKSDRISELLVQKPTIDLRVFGSSRTAGIFVGTIVENSIARPRPDVDAMNSVPPESVTRSLLDRNANGRTNRPRYLDRPSGPHLTDYQENRGIEVSLADQRP